MYSEQAKMVAENKKGYRNDSLYGEEKTDLTEVVLFETVELGNLDIFYTLHDNFSSFAIIFPIERIDSLENSSEEEVSEAAKEMISWIKNEVSEDTQVLWLCSTPEEVAEFYEGDEENMFEVEFVENFIIISDLSDEGVLVASKAFYYNED